MLDRCVWVTCVDAEQPASQSETNSDENLGCIGDICISPQWVIRIIFPGIQIRGWLLGNRERKNNGMRPKLQCGASRTPDDYPDQPCQFMIIFAADVAAINVQLVSQTGGYLMEF